MLFNILSAFYLVIWAIILVHCLQNNNLYPIFGNGWGTKVFWIFTFVFFNPLLSLLYILCIICSLIFTAKNREIVTNSEIQASKTYSKIKKALPAFTFIYTFIIIILFEIPRTNSINQPFIILNKTDRTGAIQENTLLKSGLNLGFISAKNKIQTVSSNSATDDMKICLRNIMIICKSNHDCEFCFYGFRNWGLVGMSPC